ncbi:hypothetical protein DFH07DRAFT_855722 [Mycena maculata]|uniref:Secreted protein n=1 Tax=Mycena maculata TaxID=230809 RepID=A0AAD7MMX0_9AGAR|nr:hypothetical protein DFH07DRAFT_855722 [Mycena maculata]
MCWRCLCLVVLLLDSLISDSPGPVYFISGLSVATEIEWTIRTVTYICDSNPHPVRHVADGSEGGKLRPTIFCPLRSWALLCRQTGFDSPEKSPPLHLPDLHQKIILPIENLFQNG